MVRAPCCERMGLKKGPWTREEDQILVNYVTMYGHDNWRALPKLAGSFLVFRYFTTKKLSFIYEKIINWYYMSAIHP